MTEEQGLQTPNLEPAYEAIDALVDTLVEELTKDPSQPLFDLVFVFGNAENGSTMELYMDENVQLLIEGLLKEHNYVALKTNWFASGLTVHTFNDLPDEVKSQNASVRPPEVSSGTIDSKVSKHTPKSKRKP